MKNGSVTRLCATLYIALAASGCMKPMQPTAELTANENSRDVVTTLSNQAMKCWARDEHFGIPGHDGILIRLLRTNSETYIISASRFARDIGVLDPFFIVEVAVNSSGETVVTTTEGDYGCTILLSCSPMNFTADVRQWMEGDLTCNELEH